MKGCLAWRAMSKRLILLVVSAAILFDALDLSITQVALPSIQSDLDVSAAALQWVANAYVLTYGGLLLLGGRAADLLGRRRVFVAGLLVFGDDVAGLRARVLTAAVLVAARGLQGIGAALTVPAAVSIVATTFAEGPERNRALGIFGACASAAASASAWWPAGCSPTCSTGAGSSWPRCRSCWRPALLAAGAWSADKADATSPESGGYDLRGAAARRRRAAARRAR